MKPGRLSCGIALAGLATTYSLSRGDANGRSIHAGGGLRTSTGSETWLHWPAVLSYREEVAPGVAIRVRTELARRYAAAGAGVALLACTAMRRQCLVFEASAAAAYAVFDLDLRTTATSIGAGVAYEQHLGSDRMALLVEGMVFGMRSDGWSGGMGTTLSLVRRF